METGIYSVIAVNTPLKVVEKISEILSNDLHNKKKGAEAGTR